MALSTVTNGINLNGGSDNYDGSPVTLSLLQSYDCSESKDREDTVQLPSMDKRKPLGNDAKDLMSSDSDQQQSQQHHQHQPSLSSTSSSSCSFNDTLTKVNLVPSHQVQHVKESIEARSSVCSHGHQGNQGIKAARQRFLLKKAAKLQEAKAVSENRSAKLQTSKTTHNPPKFPHNLLGALSSSSNMSSTSRILAQQETAPQPVALLPLRSSHARNSMSSTAIVDVVYNKSSSHGRLHNDFQRPRPPLQNDYAFLSSATARHNRGVQNTRAVGEYLFIKVCDLPDTITTRDLWEAFKHEGHIAHIRLHENAKGYRDGGASIKFRYA